MQSVSKDGQPPVQNARGAGLAAILCALLAATTLAVYWPVAGHDFINFDDTDYVTSNPVVQHGLTWQGAAWAFGHPHAANWHPVTWLSHMLDVQLFGLKPAGHHLTNLLFHVANTLLLFLLLKRMTGALWQSAFVAGLFAWHPLHVESVAWVAERKDVLSAFFFMLTLWAYVRYAEESKVPSLKSRVWYVAALGLFALGLMSKPMLVTLPFVLLLLDYWPLKRFERSTLNAQRSTFWFLVREKAPFLALAVASSVITFLAQKSGGAVATLGRVPFETRLVNALVAYSSYLQKMIWPTKLAISYLPPAHWPMWQVALACLVLVVVTALVLGPGRSQPHLVVGWLWYLGTLVPVIGLVQVGSQFMADRYTYIPLIGLFLLLTWAGNRWIKILRPDESVTGMAMAIPLAACIFGTRVQLGHWQNGQTILEQAVELNGDNYIAHNFLGTALGLQGKLEEAAAHYREALRTWPNYADAYNNWGYTLALQGKKEEAIAKYEAALRIKPDHLQAHINLGLALAEKGELEPAAAHFSEVLRLDPNDPDEHYNLGNIRFLEKRFTEAVAEFSAALRLRPNDTGTCEKLALALAQQGKANEAIPYFTHVLDRRPDAQAHYNLALALVMSGRAETAVPHYREALRLKPDWPAALNDLAWILATHPRAEVRNGPEAVRLAERACELTGQKEARFLGTLDAAYAETGRFEEAIVVARKARALALAFGEPQIAQAAEQRIAGYEARKPHRQQ